MQAGALLDRKLLNGEREEKPKVILQLNPDLESTRFTEKDPSWLGNSNSGAQGKECPVLSARNLVSLGLLFGQLLLPVCNLAFLLLYGVRWCTIMGDTARPCVTPVGSSTSTGFPVSASMPKLTAGACVSSLRPVHGIETLGFE